MHGEERGYRFRSTDRKRGHDEEGGGEGKEEGRDEQESDQASRMGQGVSRSDVSSGVSDIGERVPRTTPWINDFEFQFRTTLRTLDLENHAKTQIVVRYMVVTRQFIRHSQRITFFYNSMRVIIIFGGLLTPALITVFPQVCESGFDPWIPTLIISLLVSASNSFIEVFGIVKRHQTAMATKGALMNEGWHFASLSGRYGKYTHHRQCWRKFMFYVNQLVAKAENQYILSDNALNTRMPRGANDGDLIPVWNDGSSHASALRGIPVDDDVMRGTYEIDMATSFSSSVVDEAAGVRAGSVHTGHSRRSGRYDDHPDIPCDRTEPDDSMSEQDRDDDDDDDLDDIL